MLAMRSFLAGNVPPVVQSNFALSANDFDTVSSTSTMPTGGSISRAGNAMLYDSTGKLTYAPNNLVLQANTFNTSVGWYYGTSPGALSANTIVAPDGNTTASAYTWGTTVTDIGWLRFRPTGTFNASTALIYSIWVKVPTGTKTFRMNISDWTTTTSTSSNKQATTTWQRFSYAIPAGTLLNTGSIAAALFTALGSPADGIAAGDILHVWGPQLEAVTYETSPSGTYYLNYPTPNTTSAYYGPRFDYDPVTLQPKGLLVEGTRTNIATYSDQLNNAVYNPVTYYATVSPNAITAPDGTVTADKVIADTSNNAHILRRYDAPVFSANTTYTWSVYAKDAGYALQLQIYDGVMRANTVFNLTNGTISSTAAGTATITPVGNGWYRCSVTATTGASVSVSLVDIGLNKIGTGNIFAGDGVSGVFAWGAQLEASSFASSYISTVASSVARAAETFALTGYANRLVEAYYIDEETGANYSGNSALSTGTVTISPPTFGWVTSLRAYTNAYAGSISTPSWLSFSRAGNAMYYDSTGTLTWAPANLAQQSGDVSAAFWASGFDAGNTTTSSSINFTSASGYRLAPVSTGIAAGQTYIFSCVMSSGTKSTANLRLYDNGGAAGANVNVTLTSTPTRYSVIWTTTNSPTAIYFGWDNRTAAGGDGVTGSFNVSQMQVERVTYATAPSAYIPTTSAAVYGPRYDYDPSTVPATPRGLLIEESRSNLQPYSSDYTQTASAWANNSGIATPTLNSIAAPDGTTTGVKITEDTSASSVHRVSAGAIAVTAQPYTMSVFVKAGTRRYLSIGFGYQNSRVIWDTQTSTFAGVTAGTTAPTAYSAQNVGNGWYRVQVTFTPTVGNLSPAIFLYNGSESYTGDGTSSVYLWGAQLEAGSFATSYTPTTTASVTRAADVAQLTGSALTVAGAATGTAIVQSALQLGPSAVGRYILTSSATRFLIYDSGFGTRTQSYNGTSVANAIIGGSGNWSTGPVRSAIGWNSSGNSIVANNGTVTNSAFQMGSAASATLLQYGGVGWFASLALYSQRLPDTILAQKSTVGAPY